MRDVRSLRVDVRAGTMKLRLVIISLFPLMLISCGGPPRKAQVREVEKVITHKVVQGETWESIAVDFYSEAGRGGELAVYNGQDPAEMPDESSGVRIPLSRTDLRSLETRLDAASAYNLGLEHASKGNYAKAVEEFQRALEIDGHFTDAAFNLAVTYQRLGLHTKAAAVLSDLVVYDPDNPDYFFAMGNSLFHAGDLEGAKEAFTAALSLDEGHLKSLFSLAVVFEKMGEVDEAIRSWREYLERDSRGDWAGEARSRLEALVRSSGHEPE